MLQCMSLLLALRVVSRPRSISVDSGAKRTLSRIFDLDSAISLSLDLGARGVDRGGEYWERGAGPFASASPINATRGARWSQRWMIGVGW
jgi:hypothetical protein